MKSVSRRGFMIGAAAALLAYPFLETRLIQVKKYVISIKGLPSIFNGFTILHLSDLHDKEYGVNQERLVKIINKDDYNIVAFTGDLVDKRNPKIEPGIQLLKQLNHKPVYFVPGNHEWWTGFEFRPQLEELGVRVLENKAEKFTLNGQQLWIAGVDDPYLGRDNLEQALFNVNNNHNGTKVLLAHAPNIYVNAIKEGVDLVLTGHTHGGQIRLPIAGAVVAPGQGFFPKLDYGLFTSGQTSMIINGGLGESVLPIRFNIRPEIVLVTLKSG